MTDPRTPLRFTAPDGFAAPHPLACDCRDCRLRRNARVRTPEAGRPIHTCED